MKRVVMVSVFFVILFSTRDHTIAGGVGDPGATLNKGTWAFGPEVSGVGREIRPE